MGRVQTVSISHRSASQRRSLARTVDFLAGTLGLVLAAPLLVCAAVAVRLSSHGPVLHREPGIDPRGRRTELLSFRVMVDGGASEAHARLRAVVGAGNRLPLTGVGRVLALTRIERLPRLLGLVAGRSSLFG